ncbi:MAG: site-specific integrase [Chloroflexi bacterium]|nr:site-specific integrase [Chloroflexota bacterium]
MRGFYFVRGNGRDPVTPVTPNLTSKWVSDALDAAGINADTNRPQILRHTFNAMVKRRASTENTARMSRHDPMLTMRVYGRLGDPEIDAEYIKVSATINLPPPPAHLGIQHQLPMEGG